MRGRKLPPAVLAVDPRGADALRLFDIGDDGEKTLLYVNDRDKGGIWYLAHLRSEYASGVSRDRRRARRMPNAMSVETTIAPERRGERNDDDHLDLRKGRTGPAARAAPQPAHRRGELLSSDGGRRPGRRRRSSRRSSTRMPTRRWSFPSRWPSGRSTWSRSLTTARRRKSCAMPATATSSSAHATAGIRTWARSATPPISS